ncbi:nitrate- and nitrite sensing domain-containing protein [Nonomuraea roseoviolacea]|uniref:histidine kinase n=1 Tax=Nonomuraea roseoviolacea subsp. carminata TaxID=160689 RepID=A0ABT1JU36_9ACTN|nr:nitrate- and nitrite sensing domain-containing protein [Nonomuraea roseoviolacea]MCP2345258.1 signal transduction histidine kinase [Nonomuraea roseoviolacea subsp. carminata]
MRNWRVRTKLLVLIVIPTVAALALGGLRVVSSVTSASEYERVYQTAVLAGKLTGLAHETELERDLTATFVAQDRKGDRNPVTAQYSTVDRLVADLRPDVAALAASDSPLRAEAVRVKNRFDELPSSRRTATESKLNVASVIELYDRSISDFLGLNATIDQGAVDKELTDTVAGFAALSRAKQYVSRQRALLVSALAVGHFSQDELDAFIAARAQRNSELAAFRAQVPLALRQAYDDTVSGQAVDRAELIQARALALQDAGQPLTDPGLDLTGDGQAWFTAVTETIDGMRQVEQRVADSIMLRSRTVQVSEQQGAMVFAIAIAGLLVLVLLVTVLMARSLSSPLRRLRREALLIAGRRLPETVQRLRDSDTAGVPDVEPIGVVGDDEIGEVARAFDEVHREAVRLAGQESRLRSNVNAMFVNLSRRSQTLVERQITLIDGLEQGEQDESRLANLFKLDHLATRMRRNSENLLVLAGQDPPRRWSQPVKLVDVTRASLSEVENYERVVLQVPDGVSVAGQAVNDVIHLLAELVENALSFSPRETRVTVSGSRIDGGGVMLSITDAGIGMTQDELVQANERLTDAPTVDVSASRRMGLFVVARLAHRHGIRVQLRPHASGGLTAMVLLPDSLLGNPSPAYANPPGPAQEDSFSGPRLAPSPAPTPTWTAGGYQPGPGHPSFPSGPSGLSGPPGLSGPSGPDRHNGWPAMPSWPSEPSGWPSEPRAGFDTNDSWLPPQDSGWNGNGLPRRPPLDDPHPWGAPDPPIERPFDRPLGRPRPSRPDFPETDAASTGPIPRVDSQPSAGDDYLPIFAAVESAWFAGGASWGSSKADAGWSAAEAVVEPVRDGATASGLPKRVPKANLVPGSAGGAAPPKGVTPMPAVSPDRVRNRLSSFQQGFRAAREDINEGKAYPAGPRDAGSSEEGA